MSMSEPKDPDMADTAELPLMPSEPNAEASAGSGRVRVDYAALTHQGHVRPNNEDHYFVSRFGRFLTTLVTNLEGQENTLFEEEGYAMAVADGLGGAAGGERASDLAIRGMLSLVFSTPDWIISSNDVAAERVMKRMAERYRRIDEMLAEEGKYEPELEGMGTTLTMACNVGESLVVAHVGDSRAYLFRDDRLHQLTHDHTVAQALFDQGVIERKEDAATRLQHSLTKLLGGGASAGGKQCEADVQRILLHDRDVLVLCSDGLTDMVTDANITAILASAPPAAEAAQALVNLALHNGGRDNVTVIVARYGFFSRP
jgi:serine/threonine protein phosphatase PrpC